MSAEKQTGSRFVDRFCARCGKKFVAKKADVKRGWAKCCSKTCTASLREKKLNRDGISRHHRAHEDEDDPHFSDAHLFSNEEHDCNKD